MLASVERAALDSAERFRSLLLGAPVSFTAFRAELERIRPVERDAWLDRVLGLDAIPDDGPALPRGCVPYLPCSVDALLRLIDTAKIDASDVFVDIGSGVGRAAALVQLCTGASVIGLEIQPEFVRAARELASRLSLLRFSTLEGDAVALAGHATTGTVFFLYCPFSGERLDRVLDVLEPLARARRMRVGSVDLPIPPRAWLRPVSEPSQGLVVCESTFVNEGTIS